MEPSTVFTRAAASLRALANLVLSGGEVDDLWGEAATLEALAVIAGDLPCSQESLAHAFEVLCQSKRSLESGVVASRRYVCGDFARVLLQAGVDPVKQGTEAVNLWERWKEHYRPSTNPAGRELFSQFDREHKELQAAMRG